LTRRTTGSGHLILPKKPGQLEELSQIVGLLQFPGAKLGQSYAFMISPPPMQVAQDGGVHLDAENPWPGLVSYGEEHATFFFGRDGEADELCRRVNLKACRMGGKSSPCSSSISSRNPSRSAPKPRTAWRSKPSYYAVSREDRTINPDLQRFMAKRMGAKTIEVKASHLSLISQPDEITQLILEAAGQRD
jgi:pimeloyl-ACP methyl ester carboxylesterase